ncbi:hypothetical protein CYMTET_45435, partial [Cymbomonas tetramitiformis]
MSTAMQASTEAMQDVENPIGATNAGKARDDLPQWSSAIHQSTHSSLEYAFKVLTIILLIICVGLLSALVANIHGNDDDDSDHKATVTPASSSSSTSSSDWEYVDPENDWYKNYADCAGSSQTPVNLPKIDESMLLNASSALGDMLKSTGKCTSYKGKENEHTWKVELECTDGLLSLTHDDTEYTMLQFHWHSPSEHTVNGKYYDAETHFVFQDTSSDALLVIGVFLQAHQGADNAFLSHFWDHFDNEHHELATGIDPYNEFFPMIGDEYSTYYTYSGSLTTPPCSEGVKWIVLSNPASMSYDQLNAYKHRLSELPQTMETLSNNRPIQDLNGRVPELVSDIDWTYDTANTYAPGPELWAQTYQDCSGTRQTPIDIPAADESMHHAASTLGQGMQMTGTVNDYKGDENYHTWKVKDMAGGSLTAMYNDEEYQLLQFHWHAPSEHTVGGKYYDAETHFVFQKIGSSGYDDLMVMGVLLEASTGEDNAFLAEFWPNFDHEHHAHAGINPFADFFPSEGNSSYYNYPGSLTTPPCSETVEWIVFTNPVHMSYDQLNAYKAAVAGLPQTAQSHTNNRPIQDLNGRTVSVVSDIDWTYDTASTYAPGPDKWAEIADYPACASTVRQTPVDLPAVDDATLTAGSTLSDGFVVTGTVNDYKGDENYHTWKVKDMAGGEIKATFKGSEYQLLQFHWHAPSEHTVGGKYFDAETHFVFQKINSSGYDDLMVMGVLLDATTGEDNAFLAEFWPNFDHEHHAHSGIDPFADFFPSQGASSYYNYEGSLTTPPCSETVEWIVFTNPVHMSYDQLNAYKAAVAGLPQTAQSLTNNRPIQDLNGRTVSVVSEGISYDWTYDTASTYAPGPDKWAEIADYPECASTVRQTPIDLPAADESMHHAASTLGQGFQVSGTVNDYKGDENDHTWKVKDMAGGSLTAMWDNEEYELLQFHWHAPSEHTVDG